MSSINPTSSECTGPDGRSTCARGTPVLALDLYEHSYHIDFGAKAAGNVDSS
jgi:superoxide dismutase, Fe-Mn family